MRERGAILISVLWIVLALSLVSFSLASTVRVEMDSEQNSFDSERAFFMAKSAAEIVFDSYSRQTPIPENSPIRQEEGEYIFPFEAGEARVRFVSDAGLIDINKASDKVLASMLDSLGLDRETRNRLVDSILDWIDSDDIPHLYGGEVGDYPDAASGQPQLPRNEPFQTVDEILLVKNMTPDVFFGSIVMDRASGQYRRIPGLRDLATVRSGIATVDVNTASVEVLTALPGMNVNIAARIVEERDRERFAGAEDLVMRVPEVTLSEALDYLGFDGQKPAELVSRATIHASGIGRTVRILFKREEKRQIIRLSPLLYRIVEDVTIDRWRFE